MEDNFEKQWSDAFSDYSVPPPDDTWANIETQLKKEESRKPIIFFWRNPYLWSGVAAAILIVAGLWNFNSENLNTPLSQIKSNSENKVSSSQNPIQKPEVAVSNEMLSSDISSTNTKNKIEPDDSKNLLITQNTVSTNKENNPLIEEKIISSKRELSSIEIPDKTKNITFSIPNERPDFNTQKTTALNEKTNNNLAQELIMSSLVGSELVNTEKTQIAYLKGKEIKPYGNRFGNKRKRLPVPEIENEVIAKNDKDQSGKIKIGLVSGVAPFNPNFSQSGFTAAALGSANGDNAYSLGIGINSEGTPSEVGKGDFSTKNLNSVPTQSFSAGRSLNLGLSVSKKIKKNFALESGFRVLQANSQLTSNVYSINNTTGAINSYFANNIADINQNNQTVLSITEDNFQTYNYLSIPLSLLYEVPMGKKLSFEANAGFSNDFLLRTVFEGQAAQRQNINAKNSDFNLINFSGLAGLRFNVLLSKNWQVSLGSSMQQALKSGISGSNNISYKPRMLGVNYGLLYRLK